MSSMDPDALDLDAREAAALADFEAQASTFAELGGVRSGDDALLRALSERALIAGAPAATGSTVALKLFAAGAIATAVIGVGFALRSPTPPSDEPSPAIVQTEAPIVEHVDAQPPVPEPEPLVTPPTVAIDPPDKAPRKPVRAVAAAKTTAAELLRAGNAARKAGEYADARATYLRLRREFPGTREDLLVRVSLGQLALDRFAAPAEALAQFDAYLDARPDGTLAEEASVGRIAALRRLRRGADERKAIEAFLSSFDGSIHTGTMQRRLTELAK